jgi:NCS1 family nucleobase:cation symporter-1
MAIDDGVGVNSSEIFPSSRDYGEGLLPIPRIDRYAGSGLMFWLWCGGNILLTTFVLGGYYAAALGAVGMIVVTFAGGLIGNLFPSLSGLRSARYGVDEYVGMRSTFGTFGAFIGIFLLVAINFGWVGILSSIAGHSGSAALATYHVGNFHWYSIFALGCGIALPVAMLYISPTTVFTLVKFSVPLLILFALLLLWKQLSHFGWHEISMIKPNHSVSWQYAIEANIAYAVSWFPYMGAWNRFAKTEKGAFWGAWIGLSFIAILVAIVGGRPVGLGREIRPRCSRALYHHPFNLDQQRHVALLLNDGNQDGVPQSELPLGRRIGRTALDYLHLPRNVAE